MRCSRVAQPDTGRTTWTVNAEWSARWSIDGAERRDGWPGDAWAAGEGTSAVAANAPATAATAQRRTTARQDSTGTGGTSRGAAGTDRPGSGPPHPRTAPGGWGGTC